MTEEIVKSSDLIQRKIQLHTFEKVSFELEKLRSAKKIVIAAEWDLAHTLDHCARSIEYAMQGFPRLKSNLFRQTLGSAAFQIFDWRGEMRHALNEEILGDSIKNLGSLDEAMQRLEASIFAFQLWTDPLQQHFAYGQLSKNQYEKANAMHIANHFSVMEY